MEARKSSSSGDSFKLIDATIPFWEILPSISGIHLYKFLSDRYGINTNESNESTADKLLVVWMGFRKLEDKRDAQVV